MFVWLKIRQLEDVRSDAQPTASDEHFVISGLVVVTGLIGLEAVQDAVAIAIPEPVEIRIEINPACIRTRDRQARDNR